MAVVQVARDFTVSAWPEPLDVMSAARFAGVSGGTPAFAFGGITTERPTSGVVINTATPHLFRSGSAARAQSGADDATIERSARATN
jgi:hypothetical protein